MILSQARVAVILEFDAAHDKPVARRIGMESILNNPFIVPLGAFLMVIFIVAIVSMKKMRERELQAHQELRIREMEHERKLKEMEIEKAKLELDKARAGRNQ
jgi:hypothetical protein